MNRRKLLSLLGLSPALLAGAAAGERNAIAAGKPAKTAQGGDKIVALNPKGTPPPIRLIPMAPRLKTLDGKTVYLVDTGFPGGGLLLQQIQIWFQKNMPGVKTVFHRKAGPYMEDDPALWKEIQEKGNAAIMAVGH